MKIQIETTDLFASKEAFLAFRAAWKAQANLRQSLPAEAHLIYLLLCGKDASRGFSPITNAKRLEHQVNGKPMATLQALMLDLRQRCVSAQNASTANRKEAFHLHSVFHALAIDYFKFADVVLATKTGGV